MKDLQNHRVCRDLDFGEKSVIPQGKSLSILRTNTVAELILISLTMMTHIVNFPVKRLKIFRKIYVNCLSNRVKTEE